MTCPYLLAERTEEGHWYLFHYCQHPDTRPTGDRKSFCRYVNDYRRCPLLKVDAVRDYIKELEGDKMEVVSRKAMIRQIVQALNLTYYSFKINEAKP